MPKYDINGAPIAETPTAPSTRYDADGNPVAAPAPDAPAPRAQPKPNLLTGALDMIASPIPGFPQGGQFVRSISEGITRALTPKPADPARVAAAGTMAPAAAHQRLLDRLYTSDAEREALLDRVYGSGVMRQIAGVNQRIAEPADWLRDAATRTATFGTADELQGAGVTAGQALRNLVSRVEGRPIETPALEAGARATQKMREVAARDRENPATTAVELASGLALPFGQVYQRLINAGWHPAQAVAALSGGTGALVGAGEADPNTNADVGEQLIDRTLGAAGGGLTGAATGLGLHWGIPFVLSGGRPFRSAISEFAQRIGRAIGGPGDRVVPTAPETEQGRAAAMRIVEDLLGTSPAARAHARPLDVLETNRVEQMGLPITSAEALGREARTQLSVAARRAGETGERAEALFAQRAAETPEGVLQQMGRVANLRPEEVAGDMDALYTRLRAAARPAYDRFYGAHNRPLVDDDLQDILQNPFVRDALPFARKLAQAENRSWADMHFEVRQVPLIVDGVPLTSAGRPVMIEEQIQVRDPTPQTWDYIKRALDEQIGKFWNPRTFRFEGSAESNALLDVKERLINRVSALTNGEYRQALEAGGDPIRLRRAFAEAPSLMRNVISMDQFGRAIAKVPGQIEALRAGAIEDIRQRVGAGNLRRLDAILTPNYQAKLRRLFGPGEERRITEWVREAQTLMRQGARITPALGSITGEIGLGAQEQQMSVARILAGLRSLGNGNLLGGFANLIGSPVGLWRGLQQPANRATRDALGEFLMMPPSQLAREITAARAGGPQPPPVGRMTAIQQALSRQAVQETADDEVR